MASHGVCLTAKTSESPSNAVECTLLPCIETGEVPEKYFLSPNAATGILRRVDRHGQKSPSLFQTVIGDASQGPLVKSIAHCIYAESARHTGTDWSRNYVWYPDGRVRRFTPNEVERVQGFPDDWTLPRDIDGRQAKRIDSLRYHAVGNAVTPQVAEWVGSPLGEGHGRSGVVRPREPQRCWRLRSLRSLRGKTATGEIKIAQASCAKASA